MDIPTKKYFTFIILSLGVIAVLLLCIFLPFLPGDYDSFTITLSSIAQMISISSLILVPIGIIWLLFKLRGKNPPNFIFLKIVLSLVIVVCLAAALGAFIRDNLSLAIIILVIGFYFIVNYFKIINNWQKTREGDFQYIPLYLVIIPLVVFAVQYKFIDSAISFSRATAIQNSGNLIRDIESYKNKNGFYPKSLLSVWEDYKPSIKAINRYHYELNGDAYNIYFEQFSDKIGTKEIVMYNKLDQHEMTGHNQDLLQLSPQDILRGYHISEKLDNLHWKYFLFD